MYSNLEMTQAAKVEEVDEEPTATEAPVEEEPKKKASKKAASKSAVAEAVNETEPAEEDVEAAPKTSKKSTEKSSPSGAFVAQLAELRVAAERGDALSASVAVDAMEAAGHPVDSTVYNFLVRHVAVPSTCSHFLRSYGSERQCLRGLWRRDSRGKRDHTHDGSRHQADLGLVQSVAECSFCCCRRMCVSVYPLSPDEN
jgi:hypothetical protein